MATASPVSSSRSHRGDSVDTGSWRKLQHTLSPRKPKRLQSASYTEEQGGESKCKRCGYRYPIQNPDSRQRRQHKKICPKLYSLDSDEEIESSGHGGQDQSESGGSVITDDHELTDTVKSDETPPFGKMEHEKIKEGKEAQNLTERAVHDKVEQGPNKVPSHIKGEEHNAAHSPRSESDKEGGSDSGESSAAGEHETDPSDDMGFDSSDMAEVAKRGDSLPSGDEMLGEENVYGAVQHKHSHAHLEGDAESSHRPDTEGEGMPLNVADLISKYDKGKVIGASLPSDVTRDFTPLAGNKRSIPSTKGGEAGQLSLRSKDHKHGGEIIPVEEISGQGQLATEHGTEHDLEGILSKQKSFDLICPVCRSHITNRIILRKKRRTFVGKYGGIKFTSLMDISSKARDQETTDKAVTPESQGSWIERCLGYLGFFHTKRSEHSD
ncbi:unnamed protein product [Calypogeia fissa]